MKILFNSHTKLERQRHQSQTIPAAPIPQHTPAITKSCTCLILCRISKAVCEAFSLSDVLSEVNVPGKMTKPANRIQVKNEARMVRGVGWCRGLEASPCSVFARCFGGLVSRAWEGFVCAGRRKRGGFGGRGGWGGHCGILRRTMEVLWLLCFVLVSCSSCLGIGYEVLGGY
jgi:hypothetical protein